MKRGKYIGKLVSLQGHTALVKDHETKPHLILVQVDDLSHEYSHGWHIQARSEWEVTEA